MAEDYQDKTQPATPRRRMQARAEGVIARSGDLTAALLLLGALLILKVFGGGIVDALKRLMSGALSGASQTQLNAEAILVARAILPLLIGVILVAIVINLTQVGMLFTPRRLRPDLSHLNPFAPSRRRGGKAAHLSMGVAKFTLVAAVAYWVLQDRLAATVVTQNVAATQLLSAGGEIVFAVGIRVAALLVALGLIDYAFQRMQYEKRLRMTRQEMKQELRETEADPAMKNCRRQAMRDLSSKRSRTGS